MKVRWHTMGGTLHSWSITAQALSRGMKKIGGHELFFKSTNNLEFFPDDLKDLLVPGYHGYLVKGPADYLTPEREIIKVDPEKPFPRLPDPCKGNYDLELAYTVFYQGPRRFFVQSKCKAVIWNFESSILPPGWHLYANSLDFILPSSQYSYDIFAKNGVPEDKMLLVPHGVDTNIFNPEIPPFPLKTQKKVKFLHNAIPHHRKLHERVIKGFVETFTGNDDVCLVLKTKFLTPEKDKPFEVDVEKILKEALKGKKNPPEIEIINNTFIENIGSLYTACDVVVSMSSAEGFCLLPETLIDTEKGLIPICDIPEESNVISHLGNFTKTSNNTYRNVDETIYGIRRMGYFDTIWGTGDHPVLSVSKNQVNYVAEWKGLKDINPGDYVVVPKPNISSLPENKNLYISDYVNVLKNENDEVFFKNGFGHNFITYKKIADVSCCDEKVVKNILLEGLDNPLKKRVLETANKLGWKKPGPVSCNDCIELNEDVMEFFGLYIAEGCDDGRGYSSIFSSHKNENYARCLEKRMLKKLFNCSVRERIQDNTGLVVGNSKACACFLSGLFGSHAKIKTIPRLLWNNKFIGSLIKGIFYGDGCVNNGTFQFSTSSLQLAHDLFNICLYNGVVLHITKLSGKYVSYCLSVSRQHRQVFEKWINPVKYDNKVSFKEKSSINHIIEGENCFLIPVLKTYSKHYSGKVYNMHAEDKSYTVFGVATHNCLPLLEALACDKLIIAPKHGGQLDFLNDDNSLLVNTGEMIAPPSQQYWGHMKDAVVGDPNTKHYKDLLWRAYKNLDEEKERIKEPAKKTVEEFTWERAAKMILDLPIPEKSARISNKRKVLYIIPYSMVGGGEIWIKNAIKTLNQNIYEPHVALVSGIEKEFQDTLKSLGAKITDLSKNGRDRGLKVLMESNNYSIIHFYNSFGVYRVIKQACEQGLNCRIVETVHSDLNWPDSMLKVSSREPFISAIIAVSNKIGRKLLKNGNKNVVVLPQQIDWKKFEIERSKSVLEELGISGFTVGFVGRLSPEKNIPIILSCAKMLPETSFVIVGDGPQRNPLEQMAKDLKNVFFVGGRSDVERFYAGFDLLILPSKMEGLPLVILEAMIAGTPTIASDVGAISEVIFDGITGNLVWDANNPGLFATEIQRFRQNSSLLERCSHNCKEVASSTKEKAANFNINHFYNLLFKKPGE